MKKTLIALMIITLFASSALAGDHGLSPSEDNEKVCEKFGPQAPRDIDSASGENKVIFEFAPPASEMHLCNIHFHENAEHKAKDFSIYAGDGLGGYDSGYMCIMSKELSASEKAWEGDGVCKGEHGDLKPGDTIEVHWVYTTCDVPGGPSLNSCMADYCANPELRVETQVFTLVAEGGYNFNNLKLSKDLPADTGESVQFLGSTTGPKYSESSCSPYQVTWRVRPKCAKLNINSVGEWCRGNMYEEDHAHGVRALVISPKLLSNIK